MSEGMNANERTYHAVMMVCLELLKEICREILKVMAADVMQCNEIKLKLRSFT